MLANIIQITQTVGKRPGLRFRQIHQRRVNLKGIIHCQIERDVHGFDKYIAAIRVAGKVRFADARNQMINPLSFGKNRRVEQKQRITAIDKGIRQAGVRRFNVCLCIDQGIISNCRNQG